MSLKRKIERHMANRPTYEMSQQHLDNQALARTAAFGRDRAIMAQEENLEQQSADSIGTASQFSNSASGILATLSSITDSKNSALRNLAADEAVIQRSKMQDLYGANTALAEEEDKEFEYNVNMPYQKKLEYLQNRKKRREQVTDQAIGSVVGLLGAGGGGGQGGGQSGGGGGSVIGGLIGSIFSDERLKKNIEATTYGLNQVLDLKVVEYEYITDPSPQKHHIGLLAQNVLDIIPEAVDERGKFLKVDYNEIVPVMIKAMQEQNRIILELKSEVEALKQTA